MSIKVKSGPLEISCSLEQLEKVLDIVEKNKKVTGKKAKKARRVNNNNIDLVNLSLDDVINRLGIVKPKWVNNEDLEDGSALSHIYDKKEELLLDKELEDYLNTDYIIIPDITPKIVWNHFRNVSPPTSMYLKSVIPTPTLPLQMLKSPPTPKINLPNPFVFDSN